jgi:hypothetical protein
MHLEIKRLQNLKAFLSVIISWCSIKDDYRTLVNLEGIDVVGNVCDDAEEVGSE